MASAVILTLTLDKSLKADRLLCLVRALCHYLDRTSYLRQNKELVFVSFKKDFDKDIAPATISSWIKQTVLLCYELSFQKFLASHQVKSHDVRAFAASKAFQLGFFKWFVFNLSSEIPEHPRPGLLEGCGLGWFRALSSGPSGGCLTDPL